MNDFRLKKSLIAAFWFVTIVKTPWTITLQVYGGVGTYGILTQDHHAPFINIQYKVSYRVKVLHGFKAIHLYFHSGDELDS
jgi:hypothetical protein